MSNSHNHQICIETALLSAENLCQQRGVRFTPIRRRVLQLIWNNHRAIKAYDLLEELKAYETAAKPATVYRALDFLLAEGLIHRIDSLNAFIGCGHPDHAHSRLFFICDECSNIEERNAGQFMNLVETESADADFSVQRQQTFEIHGVCKKCLAH